MKTWLKLSNALCVVGFASLTVALWLIDVSLALGVDGVTAIAFGVWIERKGT
jgi:hypothetical protein